MLLIGKHAAQRSDKRTRALAVGAALFVVCYGLGMGLWSASSEAATFTKHQEAAHDLRIEGFMIARGGLSKNQVTLLLGVRGCELTLELANVYGHDHDGYKRRWRPALRTSRDHGWAGLGFSDLKSLRQACTP